jgi:hypothetical protein
MLLGRVLVHPPRLAPAISFAWVVVGRDVIAVLVEVDLAVMLRHVDFELLRRPAAASSGSRNCACRNNVRQILH